MILLTRAQVFLASMLLLAFMTGFFAMTLSLQQELNRMRSDLEAQIRGLERQAERPHITYYQFPEAKYPVIEQIYRAEEKLGK